MTPNLIPAAILFTVTILGILALRRLPGRVRITFDVLCFVAISFYLVTQRIVPMFPPLNGSIDARALCLRAIGGAWWLLGARIIVNGLWFGLHRDRHSREARLFSDLSAAAIYIATAAIVLNSVFALPIAGVVATSGVVAIVLGLALQNTLSDVFSGIAVGIEAPFGVGHRIMIGEKIEGQVVQVNWRSIRVQTDGDDVAIIPNSLVAKAEIVNRSFPTQQRAASVEIPCHLNATPERVIEILLNATLLCPDILRKPAPRAVLAQLGPKRNTYKISFVVGSTTRLSSTKDLLLRGARRQLIYAGLLEQDSEIGETPEMFECRLLRDLVLFESLEQRQIAALAGNLELVCLERGERLFAEGAEAASLYVVARGIVEFARQVHGVSEIVGCIGAGEYVGEIGLLTGAAHAVTATALTHCQAYRLPREAIAPLLSENAMLASTFEQSVRRGLEILQREVAARAQPNAGAKGELLAQIRSMFRLGGA